MSDVLIARIRECLNAYEVTPPANIAIDLDELAFEILNAVLPLDDWAEWDNPIWWALVYESPGVCSNCLCTDDCGCCVGCGGINADCDPPGVHGYWCAL